MSLTIITGQGNFLCLADGLHGFKYFFLVRSGKFSVDFCTYQFFNLIFINARRLKVKVSNLIRKNTHSYLPFSLSLCWLELIPFSFFFRFYLSLSLSLSLTLC